MSPYTFSTRDVTVPILEIKKPGHGAGKEKRGVEFKEAHGNVPVKVVRGLPLYPLDPKSE